MALTNELGIVTSLPSGDEPGVIELEIDGIMVDFGDSVISSDFILEEEVGPLEVGARVRAWAVKTPAHPRYVATMIRSDHCSVNSFDLLDESWLGYVLDEEDEDESIACDGLIRTYPPPL